MSPKPEPVGPGQESVWRFPRPAIARPSDRHVRIEHCGVLVADTGTAVRTLETSHPPSWYVPPSDITPDLRKRSERRSFCERKGTAIYSHREVEDMLLREVAWSCPDPTRAFEMLRDHAAFYAGPIDRCEVDDEQLLPQPGGFDGGWITLDLAEPFKGVPGSMEW